MKQSIQLGCKVLHFSGFGFQQFLPLESEKLEPDCADPLYAADITKMIGEPSHSLQLVVLNSSFGYSNDSMQVVSVVDC